MIALELTMRTVGRLDELCQLLSTSREQLVGSLIERAYTRRAHLVTESCPWEISRRAIGDYTRIVGDPDEVLAEAALEAASVDAVCAERAGRRQPARQANGALAYRGPKPRRLVLYVQAPQASADRPTLVSVSFGGAKR